MTIKELQFSADFSGIFRITNASSRRKTANETVPRMAMKQYSDGGRITSQERGRFRPAGDSQLAAFEYFFTFLL